MPDESTLLSPFPDIVSSLHSINQITSKSRMRSTNSVKRAAKETMHCKPVLFLVGCVFAGIAFRSTCMGTLQEKKHGSTHLDILMP